MNVSREIVEPEKNIDKPSTALEPLFRRYQVKIKAGVRAGAVPTGRPPIGW